MNKDKTPFDDSVRRHVFRKESYVGQDQLSPEILKTSDRICEHLVPMEMVITKSKAGGRDEKAYKLFCNQNLKIYNCVEEYLRDADHLEKFSAILKNDIDMLMDVAHSSLQADFCDLNSFMDDNDPNSDNYTSQSEPDFLTVQ